MEIRIYKLSDQEFGSSEEVIHYLEKDLPNLGGRFLIRSNKNVKDGEHIAIFKWKNRFLGQAYAIKKIIGLQGYPGKDKTFISKNGEEKEYEAQILFDINSIWIYEGEFLIEDYENLKKYINPRPFTNKVEDINDYLTFLKDILSFSNSNIIKKLPNYLKSKKLLREIKELISNDINKEKQEIIDEDFDEIIGVIVKIAWSANGWVGFDKKGSKNKEKYGYDFVKKSGLAYEWWAFDENFDDDCYYARIQFNQDPAKFPKNGLVLFISKNIYDNKTYFVGFYGKAKFGYFDSNIIVKNLIPENYIPQFDKENSEHAKALFEVYKANVKGKKSLSTIFDKEAYISIESGDIGIKKFGQASHYYIGEKSGYKKIFAKKLLEKAKSKHEELLSESIDDKKKSNIKNIVSKIENILANYFPDKTQEVNYWRINIGEKIEDWDFLVEDSKIGIGFSSEHIKDKLFKYKSQEELKNDLIKIKNEKNLNIDPPSAASQIWSFLKEIHKGDIIIANKGFQILGLGEAGEDIWFDKEYPEHPLMRKVNWIKVFNPVKITKDLEPYFRGTVKKLSEDIYKSIMKIIPEDVRIEFSERLEKIDQILEYKKQIILYGPPGTGKTYYARLYSRYKCKKKFYHLKYNNSHKENELIEHIQYLTFHPAYSYEEFIEGLKPVIDNEDNGKIYYNVEEGLFKKACRDAFNILLDHCKIDNYWNPDEDLPELRENDKEKIKNALKLNRFPKIFIIIDEINRGDISRIFGELITLIEADKRLFAKEEIIVKLPYSKKKFGIPPNLYIIGTLNTADRSIALLDFALRRRFGFIEFMPNYERLKEELMSKKKIDPRIANLRTLSINAIKAINERIAEEYDRDHQIGHSYLICLKDEENYEKSLEKLRIIWVSEIIPLLNEYFYNNEEKLKKILNYINLDDFEDGDIIQILNQIVKNND
ncbi:MAG: McrB family protein [Promethearchaeia archaeon]